MWDVINRVIREDGRVLSCTRSDGRFVIEILEPLGNNQFVRHSYAEARQFSRAMDLADINYSRPYSRYNPIHDACVCHPDGDSLRALDFFMPAVCRLVVKSDGKGVVAEVWGDKDEFWAGCGETLYEALPNILPDYWKEQIATGPTIVRL